MLKSKTCWLIRTDIVFAEQLHSHDGKDENDNAKDEGQVTQGSDRSTHDWYEQVQCGPWFGQFENSQLKSIKEIISKE